MIIPRDPEIVFILGKILIISNEVFGDLLKISDFPKFVQGPDQRFQIFSKAFRRQPKIPEDF